jgi:GT2 family glycosyltransferase
MVKKHFKNVMLIENTENAGFAKGCNLGAKQAKGEYLLFLNSDTEMTDNPLLHMVEDLENDAKVGVVGGALTNFDGTPQRSFGPFYGLKEVTLMLFGGERTELLVNKANDVKPIDWVSGGFMMVKKEVFDGIGGFDERFFMYIEDMELCYRVRKKGHTVLHDPRAVVKHLGQGSSNKGFAIINIFKGLKIFYKKHKNTVSYTVLVLLLWTKAYLAIILGKIRHNTTLVETYQKTLA